MATFHQRNRIVVFRLTQEEYDTLRSACIEAGARNLSDFTRSELLKADACSSSIERKFHEINQKLSALQDLITSGVSGRTAFAESQVAVARNGAAGE